MKKIVMKNSAFKKIAEIAYFLGVQPFRQFSGSKDYWETRYKNGGTSGSGSYDKLAEFKAQVINEVVDGYSVKTVIEYGCGDGNQLRLSNYPSYVGFDVSETAISSCHRLFAEDKTKTFKLLSEYQGDRADLTLSLDVIYHLIEDDVYVEYMERLFDTSDDLVLIYSSNADVQAKLQALHVKHRKFSSWIENNRPNWRLIDYKRNKYPLDERGEGSFADFYLYRLEC